MQAITKYAYGGPEVLDLKEIERPQIKPDQILVKIKANSANPADWHVMRGKPLFARLSFGLLKPNVEVLGADFAGVVEEVGEQVKVFEIGDAVYGESLRGGAFSEYVAVEAAVCAKMPEGSTFEEMAALPVAGLTALQALVDHGKVQAGERVLINGSSGGVGHLTVQLAKALGAHVTGVCSKRNEEFVLSIGADELIAYDEVDIHQHDELFDLVIDNHGNLNFVDYKRMGARGVTVGFTTLSHMFSVISKSAFSKYSLAQFTAKANTRDLETLATMVKEGKLKAHIEKAYPYTQIPDAIGYIEQMHTRGKVVMTW